MNETIYKAHNLLSTLSTIDNIYKKTIRQLKVKTYSLKK
jgi:hypothetical protein